MIETTITEDIFYKYLEPYTTYEDDDFVVVAKPPKMHCAPIPLKAEPTLCDYVFDRYPEVKLVSGYKKDEGGLVHRLDYETSGLVLFAKNNAAWNCVKNQSDNSFTKTYSLLCESSGNGLIGSKPLLLAPKAVSSNNWNSLLRKHDYKTIVNLLDDKVESYFRPYGKGSKLVSCIESDIDANKSKKKLTTCRYRTNIVKKLVYNDKIYAEVEITKGFRHQIRAHFAWQGLALCGDSLYGDSTNEENCNLFLRSTKISFLCPNGLKQTVTMSPNNKTC